MKLIDEKGRLLGKANVIDFLILSMLFLVIAVGAYKFIINRNTGPDETVTKDIYLTVKTRIQPEEVIAQLKVGDKLVARGAYQEAEIVSIDSVPSSWVAWTDTGEAVNTTHPIWKDVVVVIKDRGDSMAPIVRVGGQEARTGKEFIVKTQSAEIPSIAYNIRFE